MPRHLLLNPKFNRFVRMLEVYVTGAPIGAAQIALGILEGGLWPSAYATGDPYLGVGSDVEAICHWKGEPGALTRMLLGAGGKARAGFIEPYDGPTIGDTAEPLYQVHHLLQHAPAYVTALALRKREHAVPKTCAQCGETFYSSMPDAKWCHHRCQQAAFRARKSGRTKGNQG